ncbi:MAG: helix-turn-helix transcriptional regulator [Oscillospiraceae bacterium]|nr:helix-turn-helix transcriptional regulator [Oscillospiraceae bacterium]
MDKKLTLLPDLSGHYSYGDAELNGFPVFTNNPDMDVYKSFASQYHWHPDLGFCFVRYGSTDFFVNGNTVTVGEGECLFVNSRRLHCCLSPEIAPNQHIAARIKPTLFPAEASVVINYLNRKFGFGNVDYIHMDNSKPWHKEAIDHVLKLHDLMQSVKSDPLPVISEAINLVSIICNHIEEAAEDDSENEDQILFLEMTRFVQENYSKKFHIVDIANSVHVSRAKTYHLFERFAHMSPNTYLTNYRLAKSVDYLRSTNLSILEIASLCGFQSASYFTSVFRSEKGMTPREYRNKQNK